MIVYSSESALSTIESALHETGTVALNQSLGRSQIPPFSWMQTKGPVRYSLDYTQIGDRVTLDTTHFVGLITNGTLRSIAYNPHLSRFEVMSNTYGIYRSEWQEFKDVFKDIIGTKVRRPEDYTVREVITHSDTAEGAALKLKEDMEQDGKFTKTASFAVNALRAGVLYAGCVALGVASPPWDEDEVALNKAQAEFQELIEQHPNGFPACYDEATDQYTDLPCVISGGYMKGFILTPQLSEIYNECVTDIQKDDDLLASEQRDAFAECDNELINSTLPLLGGNALAIETGHTVAKLDTQVIPQCNTGLTNVPCMLINPGFLHNHRGGATGILTPELEEQYAGCLLAGDLNLSKHFSQRDSHYDLCFDAIQTQITPPICERLYNHPHGIFTNAPCQWGQFTVTEDLSQRYENCWNHFVSQLVHQSVKNQGFAACNERFIEIITEEEAERQQTQRELLRQAEEAREAEKIEALRRPSDSAMRNAPACDTGLTQTPCTSDLVGGNIITPRLRYNYSACVTEVYNNPTTNILQKSKGYEACVEEDLKAFAEPIPPDEQTQPVEPEQSSISIVEPKGGSVTTPYIPPVETPPSQTAPTPAPSTTRRPTEPCISRYYGERWTNAPCMDPQVGLITRDMKSEYASCIRYGSPSGLPHLSSSIRGQACLSQVRPKQPHQDKCDNPLLDVLPECREEDTPPSTAPKFNFGD